MREDCVIRSQRLPHMCSADQPFRQPTLISLAIHCILLSLQKHCLQAFDSSTCLEMLPPACYDRVHGPQTDKDGPCVLAVVAPSIPQTHTQTAAASLVEAATSGEGQEGEGRGKKEKRTRKKKDPAGPKRALTAYLVYINSKREQIIRENPDADIKDQVPHLCPPSPPPRVPISVPHPCSSFTGTLSRDNTSCMQCAVSTGSAVMCSSWSVCVFVCVCRSVCVSA